jgi:hypothetical protein
VLRDVAVEGGAPQRRRDFRASTSALFGCLASARSVSNMTLEPSDEFSGLCRNSAARPSSTKLLLPCTSSSRPPASGSAQITAATGVRRRRSRPSLSSSCASKAHARRSDSAVAASVSSAMSASTFIISGWLRSSLPKAARWPVWCIACDSDARMMPVEPMAQSSRV